MHAFTHAVRGERPVQRLREGRAVQADIEIDRLGGLVQALEMRREKGNAAVMDPQALPHPIAEDEARIEDRNDRLRARMQLTVDVDAYVAVPRIVGRVVRALGHASCLLVLTGGGGF